MAIRKLVTTKSKAKKTVGVGMPEALWLNEFGSLVWSAFGEIPYHVGSSLMRKSWRDVDIRLMLDDDKYEAMGFGNPEHQHRNAKWVAMCMAFSELGRKMTGLPIDFQIQQTTLANKQYSRSGGHWRSALGFTELRTYKPSEFELKYKCEVVGCDNLKAPDSKHCPACKHDLENRK